MRSHDAVLATTLVAVLTAIYLSNGTIAPTHDASASVFLAAHLVRDGRLAFTPSRDPLLFTWKWRPGPDAPSADVRIRSLDEVLAGAPARTHYAAGRLVPTPNYCIVPSMRVDPATGETLFVSLYGPGAGLAAAPAMALARLADADLRDPWWVWYAAKLAASIFCAASAAFVHLTCRQFLGRGPSLALAAVYGLGTCLWSMSSQTLWQHGPNTFFLAVGTWLLVRSRSLAPGPLAACGAAFAAATACRPTSALYAASIGAWLLFRNRRAALGFVVGAAPLALLLAAYNWHFLGTPLRSGQAGLAGSLFTGSFPVALAGLLASPSRGLFVFSPFLILAVPGAVAAWREERYAALRPLSASAAAVVLLHAAWPDWWGGWGYGYRIVADVAATLTVLLVPAIPWVLAAPARGPTNPWGLAGPARKLLFGAACAWAIGLQAIGAFAYDTEWNWTWGRVVLDRFEGPLWSTSISQPGFYLTYRHAARRKQLAQTRWWLDQWR